MHSIIQLTDIHVRSREGETLGGIDTRTSLQTVMDALSRETSPDALLLTGDIADDGSEEAYEFIRAVFGNCAMPVLCIPGNHDDPQRMRTVLDTEPFVCDGVVPIGEQWQVELLDTHLPGEVSGALSDCSLANLREQARANRHRLLALHHPPLALGSRWLDACGLNEPQQLLAHVDAHANVRAVLWGHAHQQWDAYRHRARMLGCPSTCVQFLPASMDFALDPHRPPAYRWLGLEDTGDVRTHVRWVQLPASANEASPP
jgi:Icc protein